MKSFIIKSIIIVAGLLLIDFTIGKVMDYVIAHFGMKGDYLKIDYMLKESQDDIIILGASDAICSTIPTIMEDSLSMTCYNGGCSSQQLPFFDAMLQSLILRHKPKMLLLSLNPEALTSESYGRFSLLKPYYNTIYPTIDSTLIKVEGDKSVLLNSSFYRYNTVGFRIFLSYIVDRGSRKNKGFSPKKLNGNYPDLLPERNDDKDFKDMPCEHLSNIIKCCKDNDIRLFVYVTPKYKDYGTKGEMTIGSKRIKEFCDKDNIAFLDYSQSFLKHEEFFYDNVHLNEKGANIFTDMLIHDIKRMNYSN